MAFLGTEGLDRQCRDSREQTEAGFRGHGDAPVEWRFSGRQGFRAGVRATGFAGFRALYRPRVQADNDGFGSGNLSRGEGVQVCGGEVEGVYWVDGGGESVVSIFLATGASPG